MAYEHAMPAPAGTVGALSETRGYPMLALGCPVFTADGEQIGTVKEVRDTAFKVDAPMQFDYWLSTAGIRVVTSSRVDLAYTKDRLDTYKLKEGYVSD